jgi:threonine aldolase
MLGGGMRQAGIIAAAGIVALEKMVERLAEDHANARRLAEGLAQIPGFTVNPEKNPTNIVIFESPQSMSGPGFIDSLNKQGVKMLNRGGHKVRAVTHCMITTKDIDETLERIRRVVKAAS